MNNVSWIALVLATLALGVALYALGVAREKRGLRLMSEASVDDLSKLQALLSEVIYRAPDIKRQSDAISSAHLTSARNASFAKEEERQRQYRQSLI